MLAVKRAQSTFGQKPGHTLRRDRVEVMGIESLEAARKSTNDQSGSTTPSANPDRNETMNHAHHHDDRSDISDTLLTPRQVASIFHVDPTTVRRWAQAGKIGYTRTPGGHHRYHNREIQELAHSLQQKPNSRSGEVPHQGNPYPMNSRIPAERHAHDRG